VVVSEASMRLALVIAEELRRAAPGVCLGVLRGEMDVRRRDEPVEALLRAGELAVVTALGGAAVTGLPEIDATRMAYRALGKDPVRFRGTGEVLLRRLTQGKPLPRVNAVVDLAGLLALESRCSIGVYDLERVAEPFVLRRGAPGERYRGAGKELLELEGLPILADAEGPFGSPSGDGERALLEPGRRRVALIAYSFRGGEGLAALLARAAELLERHAAARQVTTELVQADAAPGRR
jgi:DNA/RNA-binding domain of Phe-tRNA-synthetase-like protein